MHFPFSSLWHKYIYLQILNYGLMKSLRALTKALFLSKQRIKLWSVAERFFFSQTVCISDSLLLHLNATESQKPPKLGGPGNRGNLISNPTPGLRQGLVCGCFSLMRTVDWASIKEQSSPLCLSPPKGNLLTS